MSTPSEIRAYEATRKRRYRAKTAALNAAGGFTEAEHSAYMANPAAGPFTVLPHWDDHEALAALPEPPKWPRDASKPSAAARALWVDLWQLPHAFLWTSQGREGNPVIAQWAARYAVALSAGDEATAAQCEVMLNVRPAVGWRMAERDEPPSLGRATANWQPRQSGRAAFLASKLAQGHDRAELEALFGVKLA